MCSEESQTVLSVTNLSKSYYIWSKPASRLYVPFLQKIRQFSSNETIKTALDTRINGLVKKFDAVKSIEFDLKKGESLGIVGRNGAGKSTLLKLICGVLNPTTGNVNRKGRITALLELGSGFDIEASGIENIYINGTLLGLSKKQIDENLRQIVDFADIGDFISQPVKKYSSGMKMRLAFAVTTSLDPEIIIIDEALAVGDDAFRRKCYSRIEDLKDKGCSLLFVSHSSSTVIQLCDRAILLESGEQLLCGSPKYVIGQYQRITNAPRTECARIAKEIKTGKIEFDEGFSETEARNSSKRSSKSNASYDPSLKPKSTISYESQGAVIENVRILDEHHNLVNRLQRRARYKFSYDVNFVEVCRNVRFSMLIKNIEGTGIGGIVTDQLGRGIKRVNKGELRSLEFDFTCNLAPGTYFVNAGVKGMFEDSEIFLHRILDACIFTVENEKDLAVTSFVDFEITYKNIS